MALGTPTGIGSASDGAASLLTITTVGTVPAGGTLFVVVGWVNDSGARTVAVTSAGLTFTQDKAQTGTEGSVDYGLSVWSAPCPAGAINPAILCTWSGANIGVNAAALYCTGVATSSPVDGTPVGQFRATPTSSWSSTAETTGNADDLLIGAALGDDSVTSTATGTFSGGELYDFQSPISVALTVVAAVVAATGSYTATGTWSGAPGFADIAAMVAYKSASSAAAASNGPGLRRFPIGV